MQEKRIQHRWEAIDQDNKDYKQAKKEGKQYLCELGGQAMEYLQLKHGG